MKTARIQKIKSGFCIFIATGILLFSASPTLASGGLNADLTQANLSARSLALGKAGMALGNDGDLFYTNYAALAFASFPKMTASEKKLLLGEAELASFAFAVPTDWGTFGLGAMDGRTGNSLATYRDPSTDRITLNPSTSAYSYDSNVVSLAYARKINPNLSLGALYKIYNQSITGPSVYSATATNFDLSANYRQSRWTAGATLQNFFGSSLKWSTTNETDSLGKKIILGGTFNLLGPTSQEAWHVDKTQRVILVFDAEIPQESLAGSGANLHAGAEWWPLKSLALRAGLNQEAGGIQLTYGIGFVQSGWRFDYAFYSQGSAPSGSSPHYFTINFTEVIPTGEPPGTIVTKGVSIEVSSPKDRSVTKDAALLLKGRVYKFLEKGRKFVTSEVVSELSPELIKVATLKTSLPESAEAKLISAETGPISTETKASSGETKSGSTEINFVTRYTRIVTKEIYVVTTRETHPAGLKQIIINNQPLAVNANGSFEATYRLGMGKNVFRLWPEGSPEGQTLVRVVRYPNFQDVPSPSSFESAIALDNTLALIQGYPDGTFRPEQPITRAELVTLLMRSRGVSPNSLSLDTTTTQLTKRGRKKVPAGQPIFRDLYTSHWAAAYVKAASDDKIVLGYPDGTFRPNQPLTRAEGVTIFARFAKLPDSSVSREVELNLTYFTDLDPQHWVYLPATKTRKKGMLNYISGKIFNPEVPFLRCQAAAMLAETPMIQEKINAYWERGPEITNLGTVETQMPTWLQQSGIKTGSNEALAPSKPPVTGEVQTLLGTVESSVSPESTPAKIR